MSNTVQLRRDFNDLSTVARLLMLVSPTCSMCLDGVRAVGDVLDEHHDLEVGVLAVWMMGEPVDSLAKADRQRKLLVDERVRHYWDGSDKVGAELGRVLGRPGLVAWDTYAGYPAGVIWDGPMPPPSGYVHQMGDPSWGHDDFYCSDPLVLRTRLGNLVSALEAPQRGGRN